MFSVKWQYIYCILKMFMMSVYEKKNWQKYGLLMQNKCLYIILSS